METKINPLAVMTRILDKQTDAWGVPDGDLVEARAAVAELVEADREYDEASADLAAQRRQIGAVEVATVRLQKAIARRSAALAKFGEQP